MQNNITLFNIHSLYNLSRYIFLKIEHNYNALVETSGITLPQLRVLWIIKSFPGISLGEIAKIGCWASPTVTMILKSLMKENLVYRDANENKKLYKLKLTEEGNKYIEINKQGHNENFILLKLMDLFDKDELAFVIKIFTKLAINEENVIILDYINKLNTSSLKIDYDKFDKSFRIPLENLVCFYNLLRTFILNVESNHRKLLTKFNITYSQLRTLWIIEAFPGITSIQLSEISFKSPSTANSLVKTLFNNGLIYKEKSTVKNSLYLYISEKGENLIIEDFKTNQNNLSIFNNIHKISKDDLINTNHLLEVINIFLENKVVPTYIEMTFKLIEQRYLNINHF
jgi:DNA-binding MarR family transcriptional regulator